MKLDGRKLALYAGIALFGWFMYMAIHQPPRPKFDDGRYNVDIDTDYHPPVVTEREPAPAKSEQKHPVTKPPVKKPAAHSRRRRKVMRPRNLSPLCKDIPAEAYRHPPDVVLQAASRFGATPDQIAVLRQCIGG